LSIASPFVLPSPMHGRVGIRDFTFEACSGFTRVTARRVAQPPKVAFVTGHLRGPAGPAPHGGVRAGGAACARFAAAHLNNQPPGAPGRMPLPRALDSAPNNINLAPESS
jgi:hypothetical protein